MANSFRSIPHLIVISIFFALSRAAALLRRDGIDDDGNDDDEWLSSFVEQIQATKRTTKPCQSGAFARRKSGVVGNEEELRDARCVNG